MTTTTEAERTCPGRHSTDRPAPSLRDDEHLCRYCVGRTMRYLEDLAGDLHELDTTVTRQSAIRNSGTARSRHDVDPVEPRRGDEAPGVREQRLPFNPHAAEIRSDSESRLIEWAEHVGSEIGVTLPRRGDRSTPHVDEVAAVRPKHGPRCLHDMVPGTCAICDGLLEHELDDVVDVVNPPARPRLAPRASAKPATVWLALATLRSKKAKNWLRVNEQGPACADAIAWIRGRVRATVDRFDRRWYAGRCGLPTEVVELVEECNAAGGVDLKPIVRKTNCTADLYAEPGKAVITCDGYREPLGVGGCGQLHPAVTRHRHVVRTLRDRRLPLAVILSVAPQLLGRRPDADTVKRWRHRGKLRPVVCLEKHWTQQQLDGCRVCRDEIYDGGQVLDLILDQHKRTGPKRRDVRRVGA